MLAVNALLLQSPLRAVLLKLFRLLLRATSLLAALPQRQSRSSLPTYVMTSKPYMGPSVNETCPVYGLLDSLHLQTVQ